MELAIGAIIVASDSEKQQTITSGAYEIAPAEMVTIITAQKFNLPDHITGLVMPKSSYYEKGLLTLGIGIVDPGWDGPVSSVLINFGKSKRLIRVGDAVLRVAFFAHAATPAADSKPSDLKSYTQRVEDTSLSVLGHSFLNLEEIAATTTRALTSDMKVQLAQWAAIVAVFVTALAFATPFFANWATKTFSDSQIESLRQSDIRDIGRELEAVREFQNTIDQLRLEIRELSDRVPANEPTAPTPTK